MPTLEFPVRLLEIFLAVLGAPLGFLLKRYPNQSWLYSAVLLWESLFFACLSALKCTNGIDPVTDPTPLDSLIQLYLELWS